MVTNYGYQRQCMNDDIVLESQESLIVINEHHSINAFPQSILTIWYCFNTLLFCLYGRDLFFNFHYTLPVFFNVYFLIFTN